MYTEHDNIVQRELSAKRLNLIHFLQILAVISNCSYYIFVFFVFLTELSALISAVKTLTLNTRTTRTIIWCANQLVMANSMPNRSSFHEGDNSAVPSKEGIGDVS